MDDPAALRQSVLVFVLLLLLQTTMSSSLSSILVAQTCPEGWTDAENMCFKVFDNSYRSTWDQARGFCQSLGDGADLAIIKSYEVENLVFSLEDLETWIGLHWNTDTSKWHWVDGSEVVYINWDWQEGSADNVIHEAQQCAYVTGNTYYAVWASYACEGYRSPTCQMPKSENSSEVVAPTMAPPTLCDGKFSDWHQLGKHCYKIVTGESEELNWHDARGHCRAAGGELASVHSLTDLKNVLTMVGMSSQPMVSPPSPWIGLRRHSLDPNSDQFFWSDGSLVDFEHWFIEEPSNFAQAESCVQLYSNNGFWNDFNCAVPGPFICQACHDNCYASVKPTEPIPVGHCEEGWQPEGAWCYRVHEMDPEISAPATWDSAKEQCRSYGGWVASIHSDAENAFIQAMASLAITNHDGPGKIWIGLTDFIENDMEFFWEDQSALDYVNWAENEPDGEAELNECDTFTWADANCVAMDVTSGKWYTEDCDDYNDRHVAHGFVCRKISSPPYATPAPPPRCESPHEDFDDVGDYCLLVVDEPMTWEDAENKCKQYSHSHLASVMSESENAKAFTKATQKLSAGTQQVWLGLSFNEKYEEFEWSDGRALVFAKWAQGQPPANDTRSLCAAMSMEHGSWETQTCMGDGETAKMPFVCKYAGAITDTTPSPLENGFCEENWIDGGHEHCYFISSSEAASFEEAEASCDREGAHLASIHNHNENQKLVDHLKGSEINAYIGLTGNTQDGFSWSDGSPITYEYWAENQPSDSHPASMCVMMGHDSEGKWQEAPCNTAGSFVCKRFKFTEQEGGNGDGSSGPNTGMIIGLVVVAIVVFAGGLSIGFFFYRRHPSAFKKFQGY